ncbi:MAG: iron ABC transporter permease [Acidimicrobiales bacterium]|nr:iron ABC transporter permease [Acidimicrobiales bacterium]
MANGAKISGWPRFFLRAPTAILTAVPVVFLGLFFFYPVLTILATALNQGWDGFADIAKSPRARGALWFTAWQATASTALTLFVGLAGAALIARTSGRTGAWYKALVTVPFVLPTIVVGGAFKELFERLNSTFGLPDLNHTAIAVVIAHSFFNFAVVARTVGVFWSGLDHRLEEQARTLGNTTTQVFWRVTVPRLKPAIFAAAVITFLFSFTSFGVVLVLGGLRQATIETEIYRHAIIRGDMASSATLALIQVVAVLVLVLVNSTLEQRANVTSRMARSSIAPLGARTKTGITCFTLIFLGTPLFLMIERSLSVGRGYGLQHYRALFVKVPQLPTTAVDALRNSITYGVIATFIALMIGIVCAMAIVTRHNVVSRFFDLGAMLPLGVSAVTVGFGILIALDEAPFDWRTRWWIVPIAHALVAVPFVVRSVVPMLRRIHPSLREAAALLGASPSRIRRQIDLPLITRGIAVSAGFAFAISLGEFGATSFLPRRADTLTAPQAVFRLLGTPGDLLRGQAMALSVVLAAVVAVAVIASEMFSSDIADRSRTKSPVGS